MKNTTTIVIIDALIVIGAIGIAITTHTLWGLLFIICWQSIEVKEKKTDKTESKNSQSD